MSCHLLLSLSCLIGIWQVYVFKDAWRDERRGLEGDLYREGPGVAKVYSYHVVRIKGRRDDTLNFIRSGLKPSEKDALLLTTDQGEAKRILADHPLKKDQYLLPSISHGDIPYEGDILKKAKSTGGPHNRIHTRLIMETYGLPLTRFRSLGEMIGVLRDAIQGEALSSASASIRLTYLTFATPRPSVFDKRKYPTQGYQSREHSHHSRLERTWLSWCSHRS